MVALEVRTAPIKDPANTHERVSYKNLFFKTLFTCGSLHGSISCRTQ